MTATTAHTVHPSVATAQQQCHMTCQTPAWEQHYEGGRLVRTNRPAHVLGDVRRCEHGTIWYCEGRYARNGYSVSGYWSALSPVWNVLRYRRAARALDA